MITDLKLPDMSGMQGGAAGARTERTPDVMMMTAYATAETVVEAMRLGAVDTT